MAILLAFITIWLLVFIEGFSLALFGISLYLVLFLIQYRRQEFLIFWTIFLIVGIALDFILFLPFGTNFIIGVVILTLYELLDRFFQGLSAFGNLINSFIVFSLGGLIKFVIIAMSEGASFGGSFTWSVIGKALLFGLISAVFFIIIKRFLEFFTSAGNNKIVIR